MAHYRAAWLRLSPLSPSSTSAARFERTAWVVGAAAATAVAAQISAAMPGLVVPLTLQPAAVMLAGVVLGARLGAASQLTYLAMGATGAAAFAWSPELLPGVGRLLGPTGGFLLAFPLAAFVAGTLSDAARRPRSVAAVATAMVVGTVALHAIGWAWARAFLPAEVSTVVAFFAADVVKMLLVAPLAVRVARPHQR